MADEIQKILSIIFVNKIKLNISSIITVSRVKVTSDLKLAKIYISVFNKDETIEKIEFDNILSERNKVRYELGIALNSKYVPKIKFFKDDSFETLNSIYTTK